MSDTPRIDADPKLPSWLAALRETPARHGFLLAMFCLFTALLLAAMDVATKDPIAARAAEDLMASLSQVIPEEHHDNDLTQTVTTIEDAAEGAVEIFIALQDGNVTAVAFSLAGAGYAGEVLTLMGIDRSGTLLGVRVLQHAETPGLGDKIEVKKSSWILRFTGLSLLAPAAHEWKVKRDGGTFDQFSGATITPRAVVDAVRRGLELFDRNKADLLAQTPEGL